MNIISTIWTYDCSEVLTFLILLPHYYFRPCVAEDYKQREDTKTRTQKAPVEFIDQLVTSETKRVDT